MPCLCGFVKSFIPVECAVRLPCHLNPIIVLLDQLVKVGEEMIAYGSS